MAKPSAKLLASTMIGIDMADNAQIEMRIEAIKDELGRLEYRTSQLDKRMKEFSSLVDDIRVQLATLRGKL